MSFSLPFWFLANENWTKTNDLSSHCTNSVPESPVGETKTSYSRLVVSRGIGLDSVAVLFLVSCCIEAMLSFVTF